MLGRNLKIRNKIYLGLAVFAVFLLGISVYAFFAASKIHHAADLTKKESIVFVQVAEQMKMDVTLVQGWLTDISATRAAEGYADGFDEAQGHAESFHEGLEQFREMFAEEGNEEGLAKVDDLEARFASYYEIGKKMAQAYVDEGPSGGNAMMEEFDVVAEAMHESIDPFLQQQLNELDESMANIISTGNQLKVTVFTASFAALIIGGIFGWLNARSITLPIGPLVKRAEAISHGDLTGDNLEVTSGDEIGQLTVSVNEMSEALKQLVNEVTRSSAEVASASTEIAASSEEMAAGMDEQSKQVTEISAAIEQMTTSVVEVAKQSTDATSHAQQSGEMAGEGGKIVRQTIEGMQAINQAVEASAASVRELGKRGEQIGQIIEVINDIADQTNLLALNAAIEAARAGDAGRGFAVVADEVRKLADRTTKATEEIGESIVAIQTETKQAVERMDAGTAQVSDGVKLATTAGESLEKIVSGTNDVASMIQAIAAAAEEQSATSEQVSRNVEQISAVSRETTEGANQAASASAQLSSKAEQLRSLVAKFKVG